MTVSLLHSARWLNPPPTADLGKDRLLVVTGDRTDFWQDTWYGFHRDDGHFLQVPARGDFTVSVTFDGRYRHLYDQAGLMVRAGPTLWIKLGIEHSDGVTNFSCVVTRGRSDWSVVSVPEAMGPQTVRLTRVGSAVIAHHRRADGSWQMMRLADFDAPHEVMVGPMACSPERAGFEAIFTDFRLDPPLAEPLHG